LVFATPLQVILFARHNGVDWQLVEMMASEHLWTNWARDYLAFCVSYQTISLIAILLSLKLGRGSEERAKGVVDARERVCRGLAVVLVACFVGLAVLDFGGY
jgi:hypothetical protein